MGYYTITGMNKQARINDLKRSLTNDGLTILKDAKTRSGYWAAVRELSGRCFIYFAKFRRDGSNWAVKAMTEFSGPVDTDCPVFLLDASPLASDANEWAKAWRQSVRDRHTTRQATTNLVGKRIELNNEVFQVIERIPRRGYRMQSLDTGIVYRMSFYTTQQGKVLE